VQKPAAPPVPDGKKSPRPDVSRLYQTVKKQVKKPILRRKNQNRKVYILILPYTHTTTEEKKQQPMEGNPE
jgi:hypothetical protein